MSEHLDGVQLSRLIDGDLSLTSRTAARAHLDECLFCSERHDELVAAAAALRHVSRVDWSPEQTHHVMNRLSPLPRTRRGAAVGVLVAVAACVAGVLVALPVIRIGLALGQVVGLVASALGPRLVIGAVPQLVVIAAVAILAPVAAYPLARWR